MFTIRHCLPLTCADSSNQLKFLNEFELTLTQLRVSSNNTPSVYLKTAHKMHNMEALPDNKRKNVVKKIKKAVNARWPSLHASVDGIYKAYVGLLEAFSIY